MPKKTITCKLYIGDKEVDTLPEEYLNKMTDRLSDTMSRYYTQHPEEYILLPDKLD